MKYLTRIFRGLLAKGCLLQTEKRGKIFTSNSVSFNKVHLSTTTERRECEKMGVQLRPNGLTLQKKELPKKLHLLSVLPNFLILTLLHYLHRMTPWTFEVLTLVKTNSFLFRIRRPRTSSLPFSGDHWSEFLKFLPFLFPPFSAIGQSKFSPSCYCCGKNREKRKVHYYSYYSYRSILPFLSSRGAVSAL